MELTLETELAQLKACRDDFQALVRTRRVNAKAESAEKGWAGGRKRRMGETPMPRKGGGVDGWR